MLGARRLRVRREVEVLVLGASGVEGGAAAWAAVVAGQVGVDAELGPANAAEHGRLVPFGPGPDLRRVVGQGVMAVAAGVVGPAAGHLDGDDVEVATPVGAAGLRVEVEAADGRTH